MIYNTQQKKLVLPEYGRNIQNMVDHCIVIKDKDERKECAYAVVNIMGNMFPHLRDVNDFKHILWDHLAIMSDFKLDIEYPYEVVTKEELFSKPEKLDYSRPTMRYRHYGKLIPKLIEIASEMEEDEKKHQLTNLIASQMKKSYLQWNKEVDDAKIFFDLKELSNGKIILNTDTHSIAQEKTNNSQKHKLKNIKAKRRR